MNQEGLKRFEQFHFSYPKSEIVCLVELLDCIEVDDSFWKARYQENSLVYGNGSYERTSRYAWKIKLIKKLSIKDVKGKLGLWEYPYLDNIDEI